MNPTKPINLMTAATVVSGYLIRKSHLIRPDRVLRQAAGESSYERSHPKRRSFTFSHGIDTGFHDR